MRRGAIRRRIRVPGSGVEIALWEWPGDGPLILLHHATGFCGALWAPVVEKLGEGFRVVALDARGHGESDIPRSPDAYAWGAFVQDLVGVAEQLVEESPAQRVALAAGHSFGGTNTLGAAAERPELFERLLLIDPVVFPPAGVVDHQANRRRGVLAASARRRRDVFASRDEARALWHKRKFFSAWDPGILDLYAAEGLRDLPGGGVALRCPKEIEAWIFERSGSLDLFALAPRVPQPAQILWARAGSFARPVYQRLAALLPDARIRDVDAGHLIPMEKPGLVAEILRASALLEGPAASSPPIPRPSSEPSRSPSA